MPNWIERFVPMYPPLTAWSFVDSYVAAMSVCGRHSHEYERSEAIVAASVSHLDPNEAATKRGRARPARSHPHGVQITDIEVEDPALRERLGRRLTQERNDASLQR